MLKDQIEQEHNGLTRTHMKRKLLDQLAAGHDFPVPPSMVEAEFQQIWAQLEHEASHEEDPEAALAEMEAERDEYHALAERSEARRVGKNGVCTWRSQGRPANKKKTN